MKLGSFLAAFTGLGFVAATPTGLARIRARSLLKARMYKWTPHDAYKDDTADKRGFWEQKCREVEQCSDISIHTIHSPEGHERKPAYVVVETSPFDLHPHGSKMRVFEDAEVQQGWSSRNRRYPENMYKFSPPGAYKHDRETGKFWKQQCRQLDCLETTHTIRKPDGEKREPPYVVVKSAPSVAFPDGNKSRVYADGTLKLGQSRRNRTLSAQLRRQSQKSSSRRDRGGGASSGTEPGGGEYQHPGSS